jgi:hypothetical protein
MTDFGAPWAKRPALAAMNNRTMSFFMLAFLN